MNSKPIRVTVVATVASAAEIVAALKAAAAQAETQCRTLDTPAEYEVTHHE